MTMASRRLSADVSMLCDSALMSAGQYAGICNVMFAWHVSMQGEHQANCTVIIYHGVPASGAQCMPVIIVRDNAMPAI